MSAAGGSNATVAAVLPELAAPLMVDGASTPRTPAPTDPNNSSSALGAGLSFQSLAALGGAAAAALVGGGPRQSLHVDSLPISENNYEPPSGSNSSRNLITPRQSEPLRQPAGAAAIYLGGSPAQQAGGGKAAAYAVDGAYDPKDIAIDVSSSTLRVPADWLKDPALCGIGSGTTGSATLQALIDKAVLAHRRNRLLRAAAIVAAMVAAALLAALVAVVSQPGVVALVKADLSNAYGAAVPCWQFHAKDTCARGGAVGVAASAAGRCTWANALCRAAGPEPAQVRAVISYVMYGRPNNADYPGPGVVLCSPGATKKLVMESNGDLNIYTPEYPGAAALVIYRALQTNHRVYSSSANATATFIAMQGDGNVVVYGNEGPHWASNTFVPSESRLVLNDDGDLYVTDGNSQRNLIV